MSNIKPDEKKIQLEEKTRDEYQFRRAIMGSLGLLIPELVEIIATYGDCRPFPLIGTPWDKIIRSTLCWSGHALGFSLEDQKVRERFKDMPQLSVQHTNWQDGAGFEVVGGWVRLLLVWPSMRPDLDHTSTQDNSRIIRCVYRAACHCPKSKEKGCLILTHVPEQRKRVEPSITESHFDCIQLRHPAMHLYLYATIAADSMLSSDPTRPEWRFVDPNANFSIRVF